jgi:hypothetical protein
MNINRSKSLVISENFITKSIKRNRERFRKHLVQINHIYISLSFISSRQKKIFDLLERKIFKIINKKNVSLDTRIFNSRFVNDIKHDDIDKTLKKSRLVIQTYNNINKKLILTQTSTIQQVNQRLIICLAVVFRDMKLYLRDIIQIYVQSNSKLNRNFYIRSSSKLIKLLNASFDCVLKLVKLLYEVSKSSNH